MRPAVIPWRVIDSVRWYASSCQLFMPDVHQSVQEGSCGEHDTFSMESHSPASHDSGRFAVFHD